jgi:intracellular multiplication protein IcmP
MLLGMSLKGKIAKILNDEGKTEPLIDVAKSHAYETPAMLAMLKKARQEGGVLAPAQFLWLRAVHRSLWYPLNNLGRQTFHSEAAGALSHFNAELVVSGPLLRPKVEAAVNSLETYMKDNEVSVPGKEAKAVMKRK